MRLLLVEDDELLAQTLVAHFSTQRYVVDVATDGEMGWNYARSVTYDFILLDVTLPKRDGITLCRQLRDHHYQGPILLLTAHQENGEKVRGLDAGADDYVLKPCTVEELCARIRALLRRRDAFSTPLITWGDLCLDPSLCQVTFKGQILSLSAKEYSLIELLLRYPRRIFSTNAILDHLWSFEEIPGEDTVRAHIKRLRKKLKEVRAEDYIETVYGMGYRLKTWETKPESTPDEQIRSTVAQTWEMLKDLVFDRIAILEAFLGQPTSESYREQAQQAAHKLAGSLGIFGFADGSRIGREIETILKQWTENSQISQLAELVGQLKTELQGSPVNAPQSHPSSSHLLLLITQDTVFAQQFRTLEATAGIEINTISDRSVAQEQIKQRMPSIILLDLTSDDGLVILEELSTLYPHLPIIVLTIHESLEGRLEIARRGGKRLLSKATALQQIPSLIQESLSANCLSNTKVLAVDDDPLLLEALQRLLPSWGIQLTTLNDPRQFWETLTDAVPDILLLDVEMPHINGIELCQVIRNDHDWDNLPILFLTSCRDRDTVHHLFRAGADDYVSKPFSESELMTRISNRLARNRLIRNR